jgi:amidase
MAAATNLTRSKESHGDGRGRLNGLPVLVKEITDVAGVRTTYGSKIFTEHIPDRSDAMVERLESQGGIVLARTNIPEFGAGGQTYNDLFGVTRNPWKLSRTSGGSSGGSAAALACGQGWLATGTDMGGSLRNPASFCGVVGLRPTPGRVPRGSGGAQVDLLFDTLYVNGPLARNVVDLALFLDAISGRDVRDPLSVDAPSLSFMETTRRALAAPAIRGMKIGFSANLGVAPVAKEVELACRKAAQTIATLGAELSEAGLDFDGIENIFMPLRSLWFSTVHHQTLLKYRDRLREDIVWNIEEGLKLTAIEIGEADRQRCRLYEKMARFFATHDLLILPTAVTTAFPVEMKYLEEIDGVKLENYVSWLVLTFALTLTNCCCLSIPVGLSSEGLPIGLQIVAPPFSEDKLLAFAAIVEREIAFASQLPIAPRR